VLKKREKEVLIHLIKNGKAPDKYIAKLLGTSQPTVTRIRRKLEKKGFIKSYKVWVDLEKVGIKLVVFTFFKIADSTNSEKIKRKILPYLYNVPQIVCVAEGEGMGKTSLIVSVHTSFKDYQDMIEKIRNAFGKFINEIEQFFVSIDRFHKEFSLESALIKAIERC